MSKTHYTWMAATCAAVAILAALAAALGVFARGDGMFEIVTSPRGVTYEMATTGVYANNALRLVAEGIGWDVFTLVVAVPALVVAARLVARGTFRGRLFALGLLGYFLYQYLEYAVTWAFGPLFPVFIAIYALSLAGIVWLGTSVARDGVRDRFGDGFPARRWAVLAIGLAAMLTLMWVQRIAVGLGGDLEAAGISGETTLVQALDLGLVVPALLFVGVLAWRRGAVGYVLSAIVAVSFVAMALAISGMVISAGISEGALELPPVIIFGGAAIAATAFGVQMYRCGLPGAVRHAPTPATTPTATAAG